MHRTFLAWMVLLLLQGAAFAATEISGTVFADLNRNGFQDGAEAGVDGVTVYLDLNGDGDHDAPGEPSVMTAGGGQYSIPDPGSGDYRIGVVVPAGQVVTYPRYPLKKRAKFRSGTDDYGDVWGDGNLAVLGTYSNGGAVQLVDLTDPAAPVLAGEWEEEPEGGDRVGTRHEGSGAGSQYEDVVIKDGVGYFASNTGLGIHIVDVSNPAAPETLSHIDDHNGGATHIHNLWLDGTHLYFVTNRSLIVYVFDVSDPENPAKIREFAANAPASAKRIHECTVRDGRLFLAINNSEAEEALAGEELLETEIWDVSDVENAVIFLGSYNSQYATHTVWGADDGQHAISAREPYPWEGAEGDISIWDITDPANAIEKSRLRADQMGFGDVTAHIPFTVGNLLYVSWYWAGVKVFDISDPADPKLVGGYDTTTRTGEYQGCWGVYPYLGPDLILASDIENGLFIFARGLPGGHYIEKEDGADSEFNHFGLADAQIDLSLSKVADTSQPLVGETVIYTLTVSNDGPGEATGVEVTDLLSEGLTYVSDTGGGDYVSATGVWTVGALAAGADAELSITVVVDLAGELANLAQVSAANEDDADSTPGNGTDNGEDDEAQAVVVAALAGNTGWRVVQAKYGLQFPKAPNADTLTLQAKVEWAALQAAGVNLANIGAQTLQLEFGGATLPAVPLAATSVSATQVAWQSATGALPRFKGVLKLANGQLTITVSGADLIAALGAPFQAVQLAAPQLIAATLNLGAFSSTVMLGTAYSRKSATAAGSGAFKWGSAGYSLPDGLFYVEKASLQQRISKGIAQHRATMTVLFKPANGADYDPREGVTLSMGDYSEDVGGDPLLAPFTLKGTSFAYRRPTKFTNGTPAPQTGILSMQFQKAKWTATAASHWMPAGTFGPANIGAGAPSETVLPIELDLDGLRMGADAFLRLNGVQYLKK